MKTLPGDNQPELEFNPHRKRYCEIEEPHFPLGENISSENSLGASRVECMGIEPSWTLWRLLYDAPSKVYGKMFVVDPLDSSL